MDPSARNFATFMYPTAIHARLQPALSSTTEGDVLSLIDPKVLVSDDGHAQTIRWSIDGGEADGAQFFAVPDFARHRPPLRIDTYIPESDLHPAQLRRALESDSSMLLESRCVGSSKLASHIVAALEHWSSSREGFEDEYMELPFGSKIIIENIAAKIEHMGIHLVPSFEIEQQMLSKTKLDSLWRFSPSVWPPTIDISTLRLIAQPFPTISLVHIEDHGSRIYVFKSLTDDLKYLYHEIRVLISLERHPNTIGRPHYIVMKKSRFGGKIGICGFILPYYPAGTLRDRLSPNSSDALNPMDQLRWAKQMTSALIHIHESPVGFFSNLKLNNIVVSVGDDGQSNAVLIDFEQRLGPSSWSPPEVHYASYIAHLASFSPSEEEKSKYTHLIQSVVPGWKRQGRNSRYENPPNGYCFPWSAFTKTQREAAQVFMLGKLLWCIFEGTSTLNTTITIDTFREDETEISFPTFQRTPEVLRDWIKRCTLGAMEWEGRKFPVMRDGGKMVPRGRDPVKATCHEVERVMIKWWSEEVERAEEFLKSFALHKNQPTGDSLDISNSNLQAMYNRPSLREVELVLNTIRL